MAGNKIEKMEAANWRLFCEMQKAQATFQTLQAQLQKAANELEQLKQEK
jgi:hypothetical protein